jgi:hypothetical protein
MWLRGWIKLIGWLLSGWLLSGWLLIRRETFAR